MVSTQIDMTTTAKLYKEIIDSSLWSEPASTRVVWVTLLAMADRYGEVDSSLPGLARRAEVTLAEVQQAIATLSSPDPYADDSSSPDGRRVTPIDRGWRVLSKELRRKTSQATERQRRWRAKQATTRNQQHGE